MGDYSIFHRETQNGTSYRKERQTKANLLLSAALCFSAAQNAQSAPLFHMMKAVILFHSSPLCVNRRRVSKNLNRQDAAKGRI